MYSLGNNHKAQVALEYLVYLGIVFALFIILGGLVLSHIQTVQKEQQIQAVQDFATALQYQLVALSSMHEGTTLQIVLPDKIADTYDYAIQTIAGNLLIRFIDDELVLAIPITTGFFVKGTNEITLQGGVLHITQ